MADDDLLIYADSARCADMRYAVGMEVVEAFVYLRAGGRGFALLTDADLHRGRDQVKHCRVLSLSRYENHVGRQASPGAALAAVIQRLASEKGAGRLWVPASFPLGLARHLRRLKVRVKPRNGELFFPEREFKSASEVEMIRAALIMAEVGMAEAIHALKQATIGPGGKLMHRGARLTAEKLRSIIRVAVFHAGGVAADARVAGGRQAGCPNEPGHGPLSANQPIVISISPRSEKTGYFGDLTRTLVRGQANEGVHRLNAAVSLGHEAAFRLLREGTKASGIHRAIQHQFSLAGFKNLRNRDGIQGCYQESGHGIGLAREEPPRLHAASREVLRLGHVLTLQPGLYYPDLGGVRLGDIVVVTGNGGRNLTRCEKMLEI